MSTGVHRPTRIIVDRGIIESNARIVCAQLSSHTQLMAVVKANGYGHGAVATAQAAIAGGATYLGVATIAEGQELREADIEIPILVLGPTDPLEAVEAARAGITLGVGDRLQIDRILENLSRHKNLPRLNVHLKIDTGMCRYGVDPRIAVETAKLLASDPSVTLTGVYSHFAASDAATLDRVDRQFERFSTVLEEIDTAGIDRGIAHISNSAAILRNRSTDLNMVRAGICLYGIAPSEYAPLFPGMRPALEWRATIEHTTNLVAGDRVGYGGTYVATEHERIGLLPVGYADGYPRALSNRGWVAWNQHRLPVCGRVSMDQCSIRIPAELDLAVGDEVTLLGDPDEGAPGANELGELVGTIGYEIVSRISRRVPVEYH